VVQRVAVCRFDFCRGVLPSRKMGRGAVKFYAVNADAYEPLRAEVDADAGFPDAYTQTMWNPAEVAPVTAGGRLLLPLPDAIVALEAVESAIGARLSAGVCE